jgi:predicted kinase
VIDHTNATREERARYIAAARSAGFKVTGYFFESDVTAALVRNELRGPGERVPEREVRGTLKRLQPPSPAEGFDALHHVRLGDAVGEFIVRPWREKL